MSERNAGGTRVAEPQLRFLRAIADKVAVDRVAEVYLFPPMRQGPIESGVGVVAVLPAPDDAAAAITGSVDSSLAPAELDVPDFADASFRNAELFETDGRDAGEAGDAGGDASEAGGGECTTGAGAPPQDQGTERPAEPADYFAAVNIRTPRTGGRRSTIFSARYRLTLKGPDRGKWEVDVRAEADAPLITVDAVIRGIQRRAPGEADAERLTGDAFRELVAAGA